mgnify:CR=1 FL=1
MLRHPHSSRKSANAAGFTLVELLVVSLILGILAVVIFQNLKRAIWKAREGQTYEALQSLRTVVQMFHAQKGTEYSYTPVGANATDGYPYSLVYSTWIAGGFPVTWGWSGGGTATDGSNNTPEPEATIEAGEFQAYINTYITEIPYAKVSENGNTGGVWESGSTPGQDNFTGWFNNGIHQTNDFSTEIDSNPGDSIANNNYRGFHYRNTDGKVRINNTCFSTEGKRYDYY